MKKLCFLLWSFFLLTTTFGQSPASLQYQAVIRNASGSVVANQAVGMRVSILNGTATGTSVYTETHRETTTVNGLLTVKIGAGTVVSGSFESISWGQGPYFIKTETDITGGTNYQLAGTTQLLSVPYALYSSDVPVRKTGDTITIGKSKLIIPGSTLISTEAPPTLGSGLIANYPFNGNANDISGNNRHGTTYGTTLTTDRFGVSNRAYSFDTLKYIEIPNSENINPFPMTLSLWAYVDSSRSTHLGSLINKYTSASWNGLSVTVETRPDWSVLGESFHIYPFYLNGGTIPNGLIGGYGQDEKIFTVRDVLFGKWFHFVMTVDSTGGQIFFNGKLVSSTTWRTPPSAFSNNLTWRIGGRYYRNEPSDKHFKGKIDDVRIYDRVLTQAEIDYLFKN